ncbi:MAG TPA: GAF domain-containing protein, partial [Methylomirabilota bacterium]|nr:GAF domain-containing protein [Methylomirabilota bacterium]
MPRGAKRTKGKVETARALPRRTRAATAKPAPVPPADTRLAEVLAQQEATGEILRVIRQSPGNAQPVFDMIAERAMRLCGALHGGVMRFDGRLLEVAALTSVSPAFDEAVRHIYPMAPGRGTAAARAVLARAVVHIPDITRDRAYELTDSVRAAGFRSALAVPMLRDGAAIGAIVVFRAEGGRFPERQVALLQTFADQAVIAVENARLVEALGGRNRELAETLERQTATGEILRAISASPTDVQPVFEAIVRSAARLCEAEFSTVARFEDGMLHLAAVSNMSPAETRAYDSLFPRPPRRDFVIGRTFLEGRPVHVEDVLTDPEYDRHTLEVLQTAATYRSYVGVPIVRNGAVIGVIGCGRRQMRPFTASQIELVKTFADQAVIAIENVRLFRELEVRNRDLTETLDQQTATSDILRVISSSPTDVQPVFTAVAESAARLCEAVDAAIWRREPDRLLLVAHHGAIRLGSIGEFSIPLVHATAAGHSVLDGRTIHLADAQAEAHEFHETSENARRMAFRTILCVPLMREGVAIGAIQLRRAENQPFADRQVALLQTFADQAVIAIENVRLFTEVQERNHALTESLEQQTATGEILRAISSSPTDTRPVFDMIAR